MKINVMRSVALALGFSVCGVVQAQTSYVAPAHWSNFNSGVAPVAAQEEVTPPAVPAPPAPAAMPEADIQVGGAYNEAMSGNWDGDGSCVQPRLPLAPYFGSFNLLFFDLEENSRRSLATGVNLTSASVEPETSVGFDISAGKYLCCGQYGIGMTYMLWNPDRETRTVTGTPGTIRASMPAYNQITIDPDGAGAGTAGIVYEIIDGTDAGYAGAAAMRASRDVSFQGIEVNLFSFGLMGARRASYAGCCPNKLGIGSLCGLGHNGCRGYGGAAGPLARACNGRVRVMTSHGFRWMQIEDELELAYNIDGTVGYQAGDIYENVDIENNLYGYQFGGVLTYCLSSRLNLNIGGKFGIYGNHAEKRHRVGSLTSLAYQNGAPLNVISSSDSDTVLSTLGELDLGLGYRIGCAWTVRGGYRLMGITGVATAFDSLPTGYATLADAAAVHADDSYLLHGGYVGLEYNW